MFPIILEEYSIFTTSPLKYNVPETVPPGASFPELNESAFVDNCPLEYIVMFVCAPEEFSAFQSKVLYETSFLPLFTYLTTTLVIADPS